MWLSRSLSRLPWLRCYMQHTRCRCGCPGEPRPFTLACCRHMSYHSFLPQIPGFPGTGIGKVCVCHAPAELTSSGTTAGYKPVRCSCTYIVDLSAGSCCEYMVHNSTVTLHARMCSSGADPLPPPHSRWAVLAPDATCAAAQPPVWPHMHALGASALDSSTCPRAPYCAAVVSITATARAPARALGRLRPSRCTRSRPGRCTRRSARQELVRSTSRRWYVVCGGTLGNARG